MWCEIVPKMKFRFFLKKYYQSEVIKNQFHFFYSEKQAKTKKSSSVRKLFKLHSLNCNQVTSRAKLSHLPKSMPIQGQHPQALSNITFVFMLHWLNVTRCLLKLSSLVSSYDTHSSQITLLLVLIPWWQIGIFRFDISYVSSYISRRPRISVISGACNLTFAKTLSVLRLTEILGLQQRHTCRPS